MHIPRACHDRKAARLRISALPALLAGAMAAGAAHAQCASGAAAAPAPRLLVERFISADCAPCWSEPRGALSPAADALVLDWIVPTAQGDAAALATAAVREAEARLAELGRAAPMDTDTHITDLPARPAARLRISSGLPVGDYVGVTLRLQAAARAAGTYRMRVVLYEAVAAGAEDSPVGRNVVRNAFESAWNKREQLSKQEREEWLEVRAMRIPEGARPERLRVLAWAQDDAGRILAAAQPRCD